MKISEMNNEQAADAMIRLAVPFGNICNDEEALKIIDSFKNMEDQPFLVTVGKILPQVTGYLLKTHKEDLYEIVGALTFKSVQQVAKMNFMETVKTVRDSYDEVLAGFFPSLKAQTSSSAGK